MQGMNKRVGADHSPCVSSYSSSEFLGAHRRGAWIVFRYFDPFADSVFVVGSFNGWGAGVAMEKARDGVWTATVSKDDCPDGTKYKYKVYENGSPRYVSDPYGERTDGEPYHNSVLCKTGSYVWGDGAYLEQSEAIYGEGFENQPFHVYEMSLAGWRAENVTYQSAAEELSIYARQMGYTHVLIDDVFCRCCCDNRAERSVAFYAPNAQFGDADGFRRFVDVMHRARIGVIIDWNFEDGRDIYSRHELCSGAVLYWMCNYHIDGIVLKVSDKRGADIARNVAGEVRNARRGAVVIIKCSGEMFKHDGNCIVWDPNCNDALMRAFSSDFYDRRARNIAACATADSIVSLSGKRYINDLPGDEWRVFAAARAAFASFMTGNGKKSTYMGCEIGMKNGERVAWSVLDSDYNAGLQLCHSDMGEIYLSHASLWRGQTVTVDDSYVGDGVVMLRRAFGGESLLILVNTSVNAYENREFTVSECGRYDEIFNSDSLRYGGSGVVNKTALCAESDGQKCVMRGVRVPPLATAIFKLRSK